jgi:four helix bundle protein
METQRKYDLQRRLIDYACRMMDITEALPSTRAGNYIAGQLIRSGNSPAFNYAEAEGAESRRDFIHKLRVVLKELKECKIALTIIVARKMILPVEPLNADIRETDELILIISKSISTAQRNSVKGMAQSNPH